MSDAARAKLLVDLTNRIDEELGAALPESVRVAKLPEIIAGAVVEICDAFAAQQTARADAKEAELEEALSEVARLNEALETKLEANDALATRAEAAEALVRDYFDLLDGGQVFAVLGRGVGQDTIGVTRAGRERLEGRARALLADPTGQRLAEERRALEACYQTLKVIVEAQVGSDHEKAVVAAVERARSR